MEHSIKGQKYLNFTRLIFLKSRFSNSIYHCCLQQFYFGFLRDRKRYHFYEYTWSKIEFHTIAEFQYFILGLSKRAQRDFPKEIFPKRFSQRDFPKEILPKRLFPKRLSQRDFPKETFPKRFSQRDFPKETFPKRLSQRDYPKETFPKTFPRDFPIETFQKRLSQIDFSKENFPKRYS